MSIGRRSRAPAAAALRRSTRKSTWTACAEPNRGGAAMRKPTKKSLPEDAAALFREAVRDATPLRSPARVRPEAGSLPLPVQSLLDVHDTLAESLTGPISLDQSIETGEELFYLRDGLGRNVLHKLRRRHRGVQRAACLHSAYPGEAPGGSGALLVLLRA